MPILPPAYIGTLQIITLDNEKYLLEKLSQTQKTTVNDKAMLQGTIGVRIMDIGEIVWNTSISASAIIPREQGEFKDVFTLIKSKWNEIVNSSTTGDLFLPILEKATIKVNKEQVAFTADFIGDQPHFIPTRQAPTDTFIARTAKWYDCQIRFDFPGNFIGFDGSISSTTAAIESADFDLETTVEKRFFIGNTQTPYFSVGKYKVSGSFTIVVTSADLVILNQLFDGPNFTQPAGQLQITGPQGNPAMYFVIYGLGEIPIGLTSMVTTVKTDVEAGQVIKLTCNFTSYTK